MINIEGKTRVLGANANGGGRVMDGLRGWMGCTDGWAAVIPQHTERDETAYCLPLAISWLFWLFLSFMALLAFSSFSGFHGFFFLSMALLAFSSFSGFHGSSGSFMAFLAFLAFFCF